MVCAREEIEAGTPIWTGTIRKPATVVEVAAAVEPVKHPSTEPSHAEPHAKSETTIVQIAIGCDLIY